MALLVLLVQVLECVYSGYEAEPFLRMRCSSVCAEPSSMASVAPLPTQVKVALSAETPDDVS